VDIEIVATMPQPIPVPMCLVIFFSLAEIPLETHRGTSVRAGRLTDFWKFMLRSAAVVPARESPDAQFEPTPTEQCEPYPAEIDVSKPWRDPWCSHFSEPLFQPLMETIREREYAFVAVKSN